MTPPGNDYLSPPLVEAVFELFIEPASALWSNATFERAREQFSDFSGQEESLEPYDVTMQVGPGRNFSHGVQSGPHRIRRWDTKRQRAIQFSSQMCAYNVLPQAYGHFEQHIDTLTQVFTFFLEEAKPSKIWWVGQRYINLIKIPSQTDDVSSYFAIYPRFPEPLNRGHRPFSLQAQTAEFQRGSVQMGLHLQANNGDTVNYLLDIYASGEVVTPDLNELIDWQRSAHEQVSASFELCISDRSRDELFGRSGRP